MARIVDPSAAPRPTARQVGGFARQAPTPPVDGTAAGLAALGQDLESASKELYQAQKIEEDRADTRRAEEAYTDLTERRLELQFGEQGFAKLHGAAAAAKPIGIEYMKRFDDAETEIAATLTTDEQRRRFKARSSIGRLQYQEGLLRHQGVEGDVHDKQVYEGILATEAKNATAHWDVPNEVNSSIARIRGAVATRAERLDWPAEYRKATFQAEASKVHAAVIGQALGTENYRYAQDWYNEHREDIDASTSAVLSKAVEAGDQKEMVAGFNRDFLAQRDSPRGLDALAKEVAGSGLDETRKNLVHGRILNRMETLRLREQHEALQVERKIGKLIADQDANTMAGMPATVEQLAPIYELAKGTALEADANRMIQVANATGTFSKLTPIEQSYQITSMETAARADPTKYDRRVLTAWKQIFENQKKALDKDHITFSANQGIAEPIPLDLTDPVKSADGLARRYALSGALSVRYGSPNQPLTEPEAMLASRILDGEGWQGKRDYLGKLWQASRGDEYGYSNLLNQLAPDHPVTAMAGEFAAKGRTRAADLMLQGEAILRPNTKADGKTDGGALRPMPPENTLRAEFDNEVGGAYLDAPTRNTIYQATKAIYAKLAMDSDDKDTKAPELTRWREAIDLATGGIYEHNGRNIPLPYGMDSSDFKDGLRRRLEDLEIAGELPTGFTAAELADMPVVASGDGRYIFPVGDKKLGVRPKHDKPILHNADGSISTERTITVEAEGRHYLIPTIVGGKNVGEKRAVALWKKGENQAVGEYASAELADRAGAQRSAELARRLALRTFVIDFNRSAAFRTSGFEAPPSSPAAPWFEDDRGGGPSP